ncbi:hypothetical protein [Cohnella hongkongensis]|uniref:50S ribosomal protein L33 n=1 Tax=Cohnella hongkongensis TaxID=178337 RepID=A0ABV9FNA8_9BACL
MPTTDRTPPIAEPQALSVEASPGACFWIRANLDGSAAGSPVFAGRGQRYKRDKPSDHMLQDDGQPQLAFSPSWRAGERLHRPSIEGRGFEMAHVTRSQAQKLVGKQVYAVRRDGSIATGKLIRVAGNQLFLQQPRGRKARTSAILPLVLFDVLALGTVAGGFGWGGFGGFGGFGGGWW